MICICIVLLSLSCPPPQIFVGNAFGALSPISASANGKCQTLEMPESDGEISCSAIYALCTESVNQMYKIYIRQCIRSTDMLDLKI